MCLRADEAGIGGFEVEVFGAENRRGHFNASLILSAREKKISKPKLF